MHILVVNCGSSSVKADVLEHNTGDLVSSLRIQRIGEDQPSATIDSEPLSVDWQNTDHRAVLQQLLPQFVDQLPDDISIAGVGHRVVHGGEQFRSPVRIDDEVESAIDELCDLAPLHNPINLAGIRAARSVLGEVDHVAVFDTAFHATLPTRARAYAIPQELTQQHDFRRYGFHGISHEFVTRRAADFLDADLRQLRLITCHLGNGASVCAVEYGRSIETSMGLTPLEGLVMGTRSGDIDPGIMIQLMRQGMDADELDQLLNERSGLAGLSGVGNDMRDIESRAAEGDESCRLAIQVFAHRLRKYIGAYATVLGGVDAVVFTGGIGENSSLIRHRAAQRMQFLGAHLDEERNRRARVDDNQPVACISAPHSRTHLLAVKTDEARAIAEYTARLVVNRDRPASRNSRPIPVAVSARHVHLRQETVERLFGDGHQLTPRNELSQPGQYAAEETVKLIGPRGTIDSVRILGPPRDLDQVEIARTDEFTLGVDAPVRASGDIENTPGIILDGSEGRVELDRGVICALRHIHMTPDDARHFGVDDRDVVEVAVSEGERRLVFGDVLVRVSPDYRLEMHIDTDEANAANLTGQARGMLVSTGGEATLKRRKTSFDPVPEAQ